MKKIFALSIAVVAILLSLGWDLAGSQEPYYKGKTIRLVVAYAPGGSFDIPSRILARRLPKYIPGGPTVIVQNMPGGGGRIAPNYLFNVAKPDGLTIGNIHGAMAFVQMMKETGVHFDVTRFGWIGGFSNGPAVLTIRSDLPITRPEQLRDLKKPLIYVAEGRQATVTYLYALFLQQFAGLKLQPLFGIQGLNPAMAAIQRGEADARAGSYNAMVPFIRQGIVRPMVRSPGDLPAVRGIPVDREFVGDKVHYPLFDAISLPGTLPGRAYVVPPGTPPELVAVLRRAFVEAGRDPGLLEELKRGFHLEGQEEIFDGETAAQAIFKLVGLPPETWERIGRLLE